MKILFLHGWQSTPGGVKPTYLKDHGHEVLNPALPDDDFDAAARIAQADFDRHQPEVVVGSSRGGAVAMNIDAGSTPLVLMCPAWKRFGTATTVKPGTIILHSKADETVPFADSQELLRNSGLPSESLIVVGTEHRLADPESLAAMLGAVEDAKTRIVSDQRLPVWSRPYFARPGGRPFLFYVVYGKFENQPSLSASLYRSAGLPDGLDLYHYDVEKNPAVLAGFLEGYLWDELRSRNPALASRISESTECLILRGESEDGDTLNYLRDCVGLLTYFLDHGGIAIYDPLMFQWWEPEDWRKRIFDPAGPVPRHHAVILTSDEPDAGLTWFHTRGMRKFGRPDLSIHNVPAQYREAVIDLCNRFIELQALGGIIDEGQAVRMKSIPPGMVCHHRGDLDDPEFNNVHVEIDWQE
jgi:hypothetical protein